MRMADGYIAARPLFRARTGDGVHWLFAFLPDQRWIITRNGRDVAVGNCGSASIARGVDQFRLLTRACVASDAKCSAAVAEQIDRIEFDKPQAVSLKKRRPKVASQTPERMLAYTFSRSACQR